MIERLSQFLAPGFIRLLPPREADNPIIRRHLFLLVEMVEGGDELARGQVSAGAEDNNRTGVNHLALLA